jgi:hypothetical protein
MQPSLSITITCDRLVQFEEDAAIFAQVEPEFVNGHVPAVTGEPAPANPTAPRLTSNQEPEA